jgi:hypothetical protein
MPGFGASAAEELVAVGVGFSPAPTVDETLLEPRRLGSAL